MEKVIFIGNKYHYIFNDKKGILGKILKWEGRSKLSIGGYEILTIHSSNKVSGKINLQIRSKEYGKNILQDKDVSFLKKMGFKTSKYKWPDLMKKTIHLKGELYLPKPEVEYSTKNNLSKNYKIGLDHKNTFLIRSSKIALTPITITADAGLILVFSTLYIINSFFYHGP